MLQDSGSSLTPVPAVCDQAGVGGCVPGLFDGSAAGPTAPQPSRSTWCRPLTLFFPACALRRFSLSWVALMCVPRSPPPPSLAFS